MNSLLASPLHALPHTCTTTEYFNLVLKSRQRRNFLFISTKFKTPNFIPRCSSSSNGSNNSPSDEASLQNGDVFHAEVTNPQVQFFSSLVPKFSFSDQAFFLLAFVACTTSVAFTGLVLAAVPTLLAMRKAAISFSKLADTAREELPSTMTSIRLSVMEMNDLTLELSELSQEITEGVNKSAQALQAAKTGIQHIGSVAQQQTLSMIEERANLPEISLRHVVAGAARKTTRAVGQATKSLLNTISRRENTSEYDDVGY
ncbi:uncharacterized protein LOC127101453 [Lathyrus oleraceus]|uniref:Uncharacterized protein n=1 Tax=Pisum sativum TaxID=3888 RepID=A0A9D4ZW25_PEA|nr:uncharacterized protein LOC127101453 [Pisum sativum]KAI5387862.1 hypothetical protein KIW84_073813 [Pisum sativum]